MTYFNTTSATGDKLKEYELKALTQDEQILEFLADATRGGYFLRFTPSWIHKRVLPESPITSIRRSLNTLTKAGKIYKTDIKKTGPYGRPEHCWEYVG